MEPLAANDPERVGPYRLLYRLGAGGMGRVYLGMSPGGRAVAVKVIYPYLVEDPLFIVYFRRETEAAKAVSGAYTASVIASGLDDLPPWLATVYVEGPSLAQTVLEAGPLPELAVWRLIGGLVEALDAVHACKLVHRDLKPANVLLAPDGPKVIDFGISRALQQVWTTAGRWSPAGTPAYMSPEQAAGRTVGPESDVFSLGSVIAFAATGRVLFRAELPAAEMYRVVNDEPDLTGIPESLRDLVASCLQKDPANRPSLKDLLAAVAAGSAAYPPPTPASFWPGPLASFIRSRPAASATELLAKAGAQPEPTAGHAVTGPLATGPQATGPLARGSPSADGALDQPALAEAAISSRGRALVTVSPELPDISADDGLQLRPIKPATNPDAERQPRSPARLLVGSPARLLVACGAAVAAALVGLLVWGALTLSTQPPSAAAAVSYSPPTVHYSDGLVIKTEWTLGGSNGSLLTEKIIATDVSGAPLTVQFQEPVPTAALPSLGTAIFTSSTPMIIDHGAVLVWALHIPSGGEDVVGYQVAVTAAGISKIRLIRLARTPSTIRTGPVAIPTPPVTLESVTILPKTLRLAPGTSKRLTLVGLLSNGKRASGTYLSKVIWTTANPRVAAIDKFGTVTALAVGATKVRAKIGGVGAFITIYVKQLPSPAVSSAPPLYTPPHNPGSSSSAPPTSGPTTLSPHPI